MLLGVKTPKAKKPREYKPKPAVREGPCPNIANHVYGPDGYLDWHPWARKMEQTHVQTPCKDCGMFLIWEQKPVDSLQLTVEGLKL